MGVITIGVETIVATTMDVDKMVVLIGSVTTLGSGSNGISTRRKLSGSAILPTTTIEVVGTPQMVFTNLIMTIHMNKIANQPSMNLMATRRYISVNAMNPKGGYQEPFVVIAQIPNHKDGHYGRPNMVALKYLDFKKNVNPNVHVKVFNSTIKANVKTSKEYIINAFNYMLKDTTSN